MDAFSYPCAYADTIAVLVSLDASRDTSEFGCNYSLGERLFLDLYRTLGEEGFREGFRSLYLASTIDVDDNDRRGTGVDIAHLREAFNTVDDGANTVIARWYEGGEAHDLARPDAGQVDPSLPSINGRVEEAYVTTSEDGPPVSEFSASVVSDWAYLTLQYAYSMSGDPREIEIEIVEHYEDGFRVPAQCGSPDGRGRVYWNDALVLSGRALTREVGHGPLFRVRVRG